MCTVASIQLELLGKGVALVGRDALDDVGMCGLQNGCIALLIGFLSTQHGYDTMHPPHVDTAVCLRFSPCSELCLGL